MASGEKDINKGKCTERCAYSTPCQRNLVQSHPCQVACKDFMENKDGSFFTIT